MRFMHILNRGGHPQHCVQIKKIILVCFSDSFMLYYTSFSCIVLSYAAPSYCISYAVHYTTVQKMYIP
jgi:hypothetical protein